MSMSVDASTRAGSYSIETRLQLGSNNTVATPRLESSSERTRF